MEIDVWKPATVLIEKISAALGWYVHPKQIVRVAEAEAQARKILAAADLEISDVASRGFVRSFVEEARYQENIESITASALPLIDTDAPTEKIEEDFISYFFSKARIVSDGQMQEIWANILAGEANSPGRFSRNTIDILASIDSRDAKIFTEMCRFAFSFDNKLDIVYFDDYKNTHRSIGFEDVRHLDAIGLIDFQPDGFVKIAQREVDVLVSYFQTPIFLKMKKDQKAQTGKVSYTKSGLEIAALISTQPLEGYLDHCTQRWCKGDLSPYSPMRLTHPSSAPK